MSFARSAREEGVIQTIKAPFGFIRCVERADDMFFSLSDVPPDVVVGQCVSFQVATVRRGDETKTRAHNIQLLPPGSVSFETRSEQRSVGTCARGARAARGRQTQARGFIDCDGKRFAFERADVLGGFDVAAGDTVSFTILLDKRTREESAVDVELLTLSGQRERGTIARFMGNSGFGFIRCALRVDDLYFHRSSLVLLRSDGFDAGDSGGRIDALLSTGAPVEFAVVADGDKTSASRVRLLPRSTVVEFDRPLGGRFRGTVLQRSGKSLVASIDEAVGDAANADARVIGKRVSLPNSELRDMRAPALHEKDTVEFGVRVSLADDAPTSGFDIVLIASAPVVTVDGVVVSISGAFAFFETLTRDGHIYFRLADVVGDGEVAVDACVRATLEQDRDGKMCGKKVALLAPGSVTLYARDDAGVSFGTVQRVATAQKHGIILGSRSATLPYLAAPGVDVSEGDLVEFVRERHLRTGAARAASVRFRSCTESELTHGRVLTLPKHRGGDDARSLLVVHDADKTQLAFSLPKAAATARIGAGMEVSFFVADGEALAVRLRSGEIVGSAQWHGVVNSVRESECEIGVTPASAEEIAGAVAADNALLDKRGERPETINCSLQRGRHVDVGDSVSFTPVRRGKHVTARALNVTARSTTAAPAAPLAKRPATSAAAAAAAQMLPQLLRVPTNHDNSRGFTGKRSFTGADRQALIDSRK
jgi:cold shock CspA family protein/plastocyanin